MDPPQEVSSKFGDPFHKSVRSCLNTVQYDVCLTAYLSSVLGHSLFENFHIFFLTRNHGHWLPLEAQIWLKFWSRTMFHLSRLTNFWGKIPLNPVELLFFLISY